MRQGKLSELIHNSGAAPAPEETDEDGVGMPARAPAMDGGDAGEYDSDQDSDDAYTNKKKGKKGKGKKSAAEPVQAGLIDSCTVEVWFREIIDLVSTALCIITGHFGLPLLTFVTPPVAAWAGRVHDRA